MLTANEIAVLVPYGSLFFAAAQTFEDQLPKVDDDTHNAVVILNLRGRTDLGSTFLSVLDRYAEDLQAHESKLMLSGVSDFSKGVIEVTGEIDTYGRDNVFLATDEVGGSLIQAYHEAEKWVAQQRDPETIATEEDGG